MACTLVPPADSARQALGVAVSLLLSPFLQFFSVSLMGAVPRPWYNLHNQGNANKQQTHRYLRVAWSTPGPQDCQSGIDAHINGYYGIKKPDLVCKNWVVISVKSLKGLRLSPA